MQRSWRIVSLACAECVVGLNKHFWTLLQV